MEPILSAQAVEYYWDRCEEFIEDNIIAPAQEHKPGVAMTPDQRDLANAISKYKRVSVESGHGTGKSTTFAWIGMWFTATRHNTTQTLVKVPCIAPTYHQLHDILWPEFERWIPLSRLAPLYDVRREEIFRVGHKKRTFIRGRSPKTAQHVQGFHADHLLWLCDEAFAITDPLVWETIEGSLTQEDNRIIIAGQHTVLVGYVHDAFHRDSEAWQNLRFNSENSPIADQAYNQRVARKYGKNSDIYRVRVLGMEPRGNPDSLISLERAERARHREVKGRGRLEMGVDCARFGDDLTVVTIRHGYHVFPQRIQDKTDTKDIYKLVIRTLRETRRLTGIKSTCDVKVDASGGWGAGVIDLLNDNTTDNIRVIPVNFGGPGNEQYADAASVMWGELEQCIDELDLPDDRDNEFLFDEISTRRYGYDNDMRVKIEPKKDYKTDFESSPDRADSLVLCITKQAPAKRVWPSYVPTRKEHRHKLDIKWDHMEADSCQVFVTMYYDTDTGIYCSFYFWGRKSRKLYVYDEHCDVTPIATRLAAEIRRKAVVPMKGPGPVKVQRVYGNEPMFKDRPNLAQLLRDGGVRVSPNPQFEEAHAVALVNQMFANDQIVVDYDLRESDRQYRGWAIERERQIPQPAAGYPLCHALCLVASVLHGERQLEYDLPSKPYGKRKQDVGKALRENDLRKAVTTARKRRTPPKARRRRQKRSEWDYLTK